MFCSFSQGWLAGCGRWSVCVCVFFFFVFFFGGGVLLELLSPFSGDSMAYTFP